MTQYDTQYTFVTNQSFVWMFNVVGDLEEIFTSGNGIEDTLLVTATQLPYVLRYVQFRVEERSELEVSVCVERGAICVMKQGFVYAGYFPCKLKQNVFLFTTGVYRRRRRISNV